METTRLSLLYEAAHNGNVTTLLELLQQDGLILDRLIVDDFTETPLHVAAILGHDDFVKEILSRKPQLAKELDSQRSSPLHLAAAKGHVETVKALLVVGSDMCFARDRQGRNPVYLAAVKGRLHVLAELVRVAPSAARVSSGRGETVLHACVRHDQLEALRLLVQVMDDFQFVNARDDYGMTVLHLAVADKQIETVKFLLTKTIIEVNATNANGFTALDILAQSQRNEKDFDISEHLRAAGALRTIDHTPSCTTSSYVPYVATHDQHLNMPQPMPALEKPQKDHKPEDWLTRKRESLMVVASLIATMAFQAGTNPPGGLWQDDMSTGSSSSSASQHEAGESIMAYKHEDDYTLYLYYNTIGFVASLSIILLLVTGLPFKRRFFMWVLTVIMWVAITAMALTYRTSIYVFTPSKQAEVARKVISYLVLVWSGVMALVLLMHSIRLMFNLFFKFESRVRP